MNWVVGTAEKYQVYFLNRCILTDIIRIYGIHYLKREVNYGYS